MRRTQLVVALVAVAVVGLCAASASAMYHPGVGRFLQRDPGSGGAMRIGAGGPAVVGGFIPLDQYADGMNLYQYVGSDPANRWDPSGLGVYNPLESLTERQLQGLGVMVKPDGTAAVDTRPGSRAPTHLADLWELKYYVDVYNHMADKDSRGKVKLHVSLKHHAGSIEGKDLMDKDSPKRVMWTHSGDTWGVRTLSTWNTMWYGLYGKFWTNEETADDRYWSAYLAVLVNIRWNWEYQACPESTWELSIGNVCCPSGRLKVLASGDSMAFSHYAGPPPSEIHHVPIGETKQIPNVRLNTFFKLAAPGWFGTAARMGVSVSCEK